MTAMQSVGYAFGIIAAIGGAIFLASAGYARWREGKQKVNKENEDAKDNALDSNTETLKLLTDQIKALQTARKEDLLLIKEKEEANVKHRTEQDDKIQKLTDEIHSLKKIIEDREKLLANRDPRFDNFITLLSEAAVEGRLYMNDDKKKTDEILATVLKLLGAMQKSPNQV